MKHKTLSLPIAPDQHRQIKRTAAERGESMTHLVVAALVAAGVLSDKQRDANTTRDRQAA